MVRVPIHEKNSYQDTELPMLSIIQVLCMGGHAYRYVQQFFF